MSKKYLSSHFELLMIPIWFIFCCVVFLLCMMLYAVGVLTLKNGELGLLILLHVGVFVIVSIACCVFALTFVSFSDEKIISYDYRCFGIPIIHEYSIEEITCAEIRYWKKNPYIDLYRGAQRVLRISIRDITIELITDHIPPEKIKVDCDSYMKISAKQFAMLEPILSDRKKKEIKHYLK